MFCRTMSIVSLTGILVNNHSTPRKARMPLYLCMMFLKPGYVSYSKNIKPVVKVNLNKTLRNFFHERNGNHVTYCQQ